MQAHTIPNAMVATRYRSCEKRLENCVYISLLLCSVRLAWYMLTCCLFAAEWLKK